MIIRTSARVEGQVPGSRDLKDRKDVRDLKDQRALDRVKK
jgi:hypothetical protein